MWQIEVTFASNDLEATSRLLGPGLGLHALGENRFAVGESVVSVIDSHEGVPSGVAYMTLFGGDVDSALRDLARSGYDTTHSGSGTEVIVEGVRIRFEEGELKTRAEPHAYSPSQLTASRIDHIGVASDNSIALSKVLDEVLGFKFESRQVDTQLDLSLEMFSSDKYGVVSSAQQPRPAGALLVSFLEHPGGDFEILEDIMPTARVLEKEGPGSTTGDNKAIANFVRKRGSGLHHIAFRVAEMAPAITQIKNAGITMIDDCGRPGSRRAGIAFVDRRTTGGVIAHLVERPTDDDGASK